eukprot:58727-Chlamydomonas_euryale.AAC.3
MASSIRTLRKSDSCQSGGLAVGSKSDSCVSGGRKGGECVMQPAGIQGELSYTLNPNDSCHCGTSVRPVRPGRLMRLVAPERHFRHVRPVRRMRPVRPKGLVRPARTVAARKRHTRDKSVPSGALNRKKTRVAKSLDLPHSSAR